MKIRTATKDDAANIAAVGCCVWVNTYATGGVYDKISKFVLAEFTEAGIIKSIENRKVIVATVENNILAYLVLNPEKDQKREIENLYVLPRFHGRGIGRRLINEISKDINVPLWLSTWEENQPAIGFYKHLGFQETGDCYFDLYGNKIRNIVLERDKNN